ncbi:MAG: tryptophan synthase subunit alpha, partial [Pseudomonadota bacterium]|nr:tryptophan synthase subunit alpha [Pseudomonadota bacterium]
TPTTDDARLKVIANGAGGFLYYVSIAGVTGTKSFAEDDVRAAVARMKTAGLPVAVGFGIRTPEQAVAIAGFADAAVVGSAIVTRMAELAAAGASRDDLVKDVLKFSAALADSVHGAARAKVSA